MSDLLERLRKVEHGPTRQQGVTTNWYRNPDGPEAADEIERLRAENLYLRNEGATVKAADHDALHDQYMEAERLLRKAQARLSEAEALLREAREREQRFMPSLYQDPNFHDRIDAALGERSHD